MIYLVPLFCWLIVFLIYNNQKIPCLLYHQINEKSSISHELFEKHLQIIKELGFTTLTLTEAYNINKSGKKLPKKSILITFDDGYYDNYAIAFPLLKKYDMKATFFLNTAFISYSPIDRINHNYQNSEEINKQASFDYFNGIYGHDGYMTWPEIKEMYETGKFDFQAHSHSHSPGFISNKIKKIILNENEIDSNIVKLYYGKPKIGSPVFFYRSSYAYRTIKWNNDVFLNTYANVIGELENRNTGKLLNLYNSILGGRNLPPFESESDAKKRIQEDIILNKNLIETNLGNKVRFFAWPWGHKTDWGMKVIQHAGIVGFLSCKKGSNNRNINYENILRVELRKPTEIKFKLLLYILKNSLTSRIYQWLS